MKLLLAATAVFATMGLWFVSVCIGYLMMTLCGWLSWWSMALVALLTGHLTIKAMFDIIADIYAPN